jgi:hypothetical protein
MISYNSGNQRASKEPWKFAEGEFPQASSLKPQASSLKPQASSRKPQASSLKPQASSLKPQASSLKPRHLHGWPRQGALSVVG